MMKAILLLRHSINKRKSICSFFPRLDPLGIEKVPKLVFICFIKTHAVKMMFRTFLLVVFALNSDASSDSSCQSHVDKLDSCQAVISFSGDCLSPKIDLSSTEFSQCEAVKFFWSYPLNNMTLVIETPFTRSHQRFLMRLDNQQLTGAVSHVYRIFNNQETDVTTRDDTLIQYSDPNYQIILKFQGPTRLSRYGVDIDYRTEAM